jgi:hypothetical protein
MHKENVSWCVETATVTALTCNLQLASDLHQSSSGIHHACVLRACLLLLLWCAYTNKGGLMASTWWTILSIPSQAPCISLSSHRIRSAGSSPWLILNASTTTRKEAPGFPALAPSLPGTLILGGLMTNSLVIKRHYELLLAYMMRRFEVYEINNINKATCCQATYKCPCMTLSIYACN